MVYFVTSECDLTCKQETYPLLKLEGYEALNQPFHFTLTLLVWPDQWQTPWIGEWALLCLPERKIRGIITDESAMVVQDNRLLQLTLTFKPYLSLLQQQASLHRFRRQTLKAIVRQILQPLGYPAPYVEWHSKLEEEIPFLTQLPDETDYDFLVRVLSHRGLFYWCATDQIDNRHTAMIHIADDNESFIAHDEDLITYIPSSELVTSPYHRPREIYDLKETATTVPEYFTIVGYNEQTPDEEIKASVGNAKSILIQEIFFSGCVDNDQAKNLACFYHEAHHVKFLTRTGKSRMGHVALGHYFKVDTQRWNERKENDDWLITQITHHAEQPTGEQGEGNSMTYHNELSLMPHKKSYRVLPTELPPSANITMTNIESDYGSPQLSPQGEYFHRAYNDHRDLPFSAMKMPKTRRLTPYTGPSNKNTTSGFHFPIGNDVDVALGHLFGHPDRPVLLGSEHHPYCKSPVTSNNPRQHILKTRRGHQLTMDDSYNQPHISLQNPQEANRVTLNSGLQLASQGNIQMKAKQNIEHHTQGNHQETIEKDKIQYIKEDYHQTTQQSAYYETQENHDIATEGKALLNSDKTLLLDSGNDITFTSQKEILLQTQNQDLHLQAPKGSVLLHAEDECHFIGNGQDSICFSVGDSKIEITADGIINVKGKTIESTGQVICSTKPVPPASTKKAEEEKNATMLDPTKEPQNDEEFKLFVATVYGESVNSSPAAWKAVASTIVNRLHNPRFSYRDKGSRKIPTNITEVIETGGYQAYADRSPQYRLAYDYLNGKTKRVPPKLEELRETIKPIYNTKKGTSAAVLYYSPKAERIAYELHEAKHIQPAWRFNELKLLNNGIGLKPTDDFNFYAYKDSVK